MTVLHANAVQLAQDNPFFHQVLATAALQVLALSLEPHEDVGPAAHPVDRAYWIAVGNGELFTDAGYERVDGGDLIVVPAGRWHNLSNTAETPMKALVLCAPPAFPRGTIHRTKAESHQRDPEPV